jgi:hypothetical protein
MAKKTFNPFEDFISATHGHDDKGVSPEAAKRVTSETAKRQNRYVYDYLRHNARRLSGPNAVDYVAKAGEVVLQEGIGKDPLTILSSGDKALSKDRLTGIMNKASTIIKGGKILRAFEPVSYFASRITEILDDLQMGGGFLPKKRDDWI